MSEKVSQQARDLVRAELVHIAEVLRKEYGFSIPESRRLIREMLTVSI